MKLTSAKYEKHQDDLDGYCRHCDSVTAENVEADAEGYPCPECDNDDVMGIENALVLGHIEIDEESSDDEDELEIISFSDDE